MKKIIFILLMYGLGFVAGSYYYKNQIPVPYSENSKESGVMIWDLNK